MFCTNGTIVHCGQKDSQIKLHGQCNGFDGIKDIINKYQSVQCATVLIWTFHNAPAIVTFAELKSSIGGDQFIDKEALKFYI